MIAREPSRDCGAMLLMSRGGNHAQGGEGVTKAAPRTGYMTPVRGKQDPTWSTEVQECEDRPSSCTTDIKERGMVPSKPHVPLTISDSNLAPSMVSLTGITGLAQRPAHQGGPALMTLLYTKWTLKLLPFPSKQNGSVSAVTSSL